MSQSTHAALTSSVSPNWKTPDWLYKALNDEFGFALDLAANPNDHKHHSYWLGPGSPIGIDDALGPVPWPDIIDSLEVSADPMRGLQGRAGFLNPPYSREENLPIEPWIERAARESDHMVIVGLIPYSPQTRWWRKYIVGMDYRATEIRKFPYRLKFDPPDDYVGKASGANVNTTVIIWRPSEDFIDPWVPHERYWNPGLHERKRSNADDPDE